MYPEAGANWHNSGNLGSGRTDLLARIHEERGGGAIKYQVKGQANLSGPSPYNRECGAASRYRGQQGCELTL